MYNNDITSIVKCHIVPSGRLRESTLSFMDFVYSDTIDEDLSTSSFPFPMTRPTSNGGSPTTMGIQVFTKSLSGETVHSTFLSHTDELFKNILDVYYDMYLDNMKNSKFPTLIHTNGDGDKKLISKVYAAGNMILQEFRRGPANIYILPDIKYVKIFGGMITADKIILNKTNVHKDKIFIIRIESDDNSPGLRMFADRSLAPQRHLKLVKLMKKMGRKVSDMSFNYILTKVGSNPEKMVQCICLKD